MILDLCICQWILNTVDDDPIVLFSAVSGSTTRNFGVSTELHRCNSGTHSKNRKSKKQKPSGLENPGFDCKT